MRKLYLNPSPVSTPGRPLEIESIRPGARFVARGRGAVEYEVLAVSRNTATIRRLSGSEVRARTVKGVAQVNKTELLKMIAVLS
jgi:hypothetical protein